jgi:uncharacterized protein involved in exopolysaccharide biosynthesis
MSSKLTRATNLSQKQNALQVEEDEIDLLELFDVLWSGKKIIVAVTALFTVGAIIYSLLQTEIYRAEVLLAPSQNRQSSSPLSAQLGGAAALVGINVGQSGGNQIQSILATIRSREFILKFVAENNLREALFSLSSDAEGQPTDWQVYRKFSGILSITRDSGAGLIRVALKWPDPVEAAEWANLIVAAINLHEKARDVSEAKNAIEYLQGQLASTQLVEMQQVFYQLIESQTRVIMLADVRDEYVFRIIDPAVVPDQRIAPERKVMVIVGLISGTALSMMFVVFGYLITERKVFSRKMPSDLET